jgi:multidrug efflux pump subunit AcrA (membrane-fusion protein)
MLRSKLEHFFSWMFAPKKLYWRIPLVGLILLLLVTTIMRIVPSGDDDEVASSLRQVSLLSLSEESGAVGPLNLVGEVSALERADLRTDMGGRVTRVNRRAGDRVAAGEVLVEFDNARERAGLLQAEGALESARAALARVENGSRTETLSILEASKTGAQTALDATKENTVNTLKTLYIGNDDAIHAKVDSVFTNPRTSAPQFIYNTSDSRLEGEIENTRPVIENILSDQAARAAQLSPSMDLTLELERARTETRTLLTFIDSVLRAVNQSIPSTNQPQSAISGSSATVSAAQQILSGNLQTISGTIQDLSGKTTALTVAEANLSQGITPARAEDVLQARAGLKQAQGAYALALAGWEKTIIRTPIFGTINSLVADVGESIPAGTLVASITNTSGSEVKASITADDIPSIRVGTRVTTDRGLEGVVTRVSPGIDPITKSAEVRIALTDPNKTLINGTSISVSIERTGQASPSTNNPATLPLSAVKLYADRAVVFTVTASSTLEEHPVVLGPLLGDRVNILSGLSGLTEIVRDARGLRPNQSIEVTAQ